MTQSVSYYRTIRLGALALLLFSFSSVTAWSEMARQLRVGVQFGLGYLPLYVAKDAGFFKKRLRDEGLDSIPVELSHLAGGPQVNDGLLSQSLEIGSGGYTAMMVYCEKTRHAGDSQLLGVAALWAVPYELFTVDPELRSLKDLDRGKDKIGVPSVKVSVPAIYLQMGSGTAARTGQSRRPRPIYRFSRATKWCHFATLQRFDTHSKIHCHAVLAASETAYMRALA